MKIAHFLLTRFNAPVCYAGTDRGIQPGWLAHRFDLFENFCLPSVAAQTEKDFRWLLMVDERTPAEARARLDCGLKPLLPRATVLPVASTSEAAFVGEILRQVGEDGADRVLTTRLDNDDAIAREYLGEVRLEAGRLPESGNFVIDYTQGCQVAQSGIFSCTSTLNPFLSVVSSPPDIKTVYHISHLKMDQVGTVISQRTAQPKWIQVIHRKNIGSQLRRSRIAADVDFIRNFSLGNEWRACVQ